MWISGPMYSSVATPVCPMHHGNRVARIHRPAIWWTKSLRCRRHRPLFNIPPMEKRKKSTTWTRKHHQTPHFCWTMSFQNWTNKIHDRTEQIKAIRVALWRLRANMNLNRYRDDHTTLQIISRSRAMRPIHCSRCHPATLYWMSSSHAVYCRNGRIIRVRIPVNLSTWQPHLSIHFWRHATQQQQIRISCKLWANYISITMTCFRLQPLHWRRHNQHHDTEKLPASRSKKKGRFSTVSLFDEMLWKHILFCPFQIERTSKFVLEFLA